jgi:hypothetical protein
MAYGELPNVQPGMIWLNAGSAAGINVVSLVVATFRALH